MKQYSDVFSSGERKFKKRWDKAKDKLVSPIILLLKWFGVSPVEVTLLAGLFGILSGFYVVYNPKTAVWLLVIAIVLDGLDGALARALNKASVGGALLDTFFDYTTILANVAGMTAAGIVAGWIGVIYGVIYALLVVFSVIRNRIRIPRGYVLRPRLYVYLLFAIFAFTGLNWLNIALLAFSVLMIYYVVGDFLRLKQMA